MRFIFLFFIVNILLLQANAFNMTKNIFPANFELNNKKYTIERTEDDKAYLENTYALTSRPSPPFFIQPFEVAKGVETYGELEVIDFLVKKKGILIDARLQNWYVKSAIPGAVNIPFKIFLKKSKERKNILQSFGATYTKDAWNFSKTKTIVLYCNGAWCGQSPTAIRALIELGYPKDKMKYYRGGMQSWQLMGLTTIVPEVVK